MNTTLDGFIAGPAGELDWHFAYWNDEMAGVVTKQLALADTILLGRLTYSAMAAYWPFTSADPCFPREDLAFAGMMNNYSKIVFSRTLKRAGWNNTVISRHNNTRKIVELKEQPGKDIMVFGSRSIVSSVMEWGLVDEYLVWIHPVLLGRGIALFHGISHPHRLKLQDTRTFNSGVVLNRYSNGFRSPNPGFPGSVRQLGADGGAP
jgi:dihydrofolate reductase